MSAFTPVLETGGKAFVVKKKVDEWCEDFLTQLHPRSGIVGVGIEIGDVKKKELDERVTRMMGVMNRTSGTTESGSVIVCK